MGGSAGTGRSSGSERGGCPIGRVSIAPAGVKRVSYDAGLEYSYPWLPGRSGRLCRERMRAAPWLGSAPPSAMSLLRR